ncbi:MAG: NUDIX domain-containing protein [Candidatus Devosia euplotis]|nr:NUDIX domain-containing protein [Candidatus Devosia euplotis]
MLVFRHPLAGIQLVKGTRESGEALVSGVLRELAEEAGIGDGFSGAFACSNSTIAAGQLWHFVLVQRADLPEQ